ncbi:MAG: hypothetical protein HZB67_04260 [Candidatus Aenigmarchaeota archaeon]|nr:hypothetical protein [Candidatus Aenigmarchaeota archaeon]
MPEEKGGFESAYKLLIVFFIGIVIGWNLIFIFLKSMGFTTLEMLVFVVSTYATFLALSMIIKKLDSNLSIKISLAVRGSSFLLLVMVFSPVQIYLAGMLVGAITLFYWIPFNIKSNNAMQKEESAFKNGLISVVSPMLTAVATLAGAGFAEHFGYHLLFVSAAFMMVLAYFYVDKTGSSFKINLDPAKGLESVKPIRSLFLLQGFWEGIFWFAVPIITLSFTSSITVFGAFLTYVAIFGVAATLLVTRISDQKRNRKSFILPIFFLTAIFMIASYFTTDFLTWSIVNSGIAFFAAMMSPFMGALVKDKLEDLHNGIFGREILLNAGRLAGCMAMAIALLLENFKASLVIAAMPLLIYIIVILRKKIY